MKICFIFPDLNFVRVLRGYLEEIKKECNEFDFCIFEDENFVNDFDFIFADEKSVSTKHLSGKKIVIFKRPYSIEEVIIKTKEVIKKVGGANIK